MKSFGFIRKSQVELNNTKIFIPFDSIVEDSYVELGDYLKKGDPILKVVDLDPIFITVNVTEKEINLLKQNQKAKITISQKEFDGFINYISKTADDLTRNFKVQIRLDNKENKIISGLTSEIEIGTKNEDAFLFLHL